MVLYGVVRSPGEDLGDLGPLVTVDAVGAHEDILLRFRPRILLDGWVQLVVPSRTAQEVGRKKEAGGSVGLHQTTCNLAVGGVMVYFFECLMQLIVHCDLSMETESWSAHAVQDP